MPKPRYIEINDQICMRRVGKHYSKKDEAKDRCSTNDYCIGFMHMKFNIHHLPHYCPEVCQGSHCQGDCPEKYKEAFFQLCFNKGNTPFGIEDFDKNSIKQGHIMHKKENTGKN